MVASGSTRYMVAVGGNPRTKQVRSSRDNVTLSPWKPAVPICGFLSDEKSVHTHDILLPKVCPVVSMSLRIVGLYHPSDP